jgi:pimeloyl-ACP methyl ester carboxylesterase
MPQIQIDDIQIAYDDVGAGPSVVLLHGYPFNRTLWKDQVEALKDAYRVITPDLRGFGDSDASDGSATMSRMANDVAGLLAALEISAATIGGLSMGGYVVLAFYKQFASRVNGLLLADTRPQSDTEENKQVRARQAEQVMAEGMAGIADAMLPKLLTSETVSRRPEVVKRVRDMMIKTKPAGAAAALLGMAAREDQTSLLSQIAVPTLILVGQEDPITPVADSEKMHNDIKGSRLAVIENAAHVSNLEQPEVFNTELRTFLSEIRDRDLIDG